MNIVTYIRRSLSARLSFWVVSCVMLLFVMALGILFHYSRMAVRDEAMEKATQMLEGTLLYVEGTLHDVEVASDKKVCIAHLVTDGESRRNGIYTSANLPGYILGSGRI